MERLRAAQRRRHRLDRGADDVVVGVLLLQATRPMVWQWVRSILLRSSFAPSPSITRCHSVRAARSLATSMKKFMPMPKKKLRRPAKASISSPAAMRALDIFLAVGDGEGQLLHRRRPGLVHVIAGDRNAVEFRHVGAGIGDDVRHDPHRWFGRIDIGVADHELLEDVVLDGPVELLGGNALLLPGDDEEGQDRDHRAVHRHRNRHLIERNAVEQDLHVLDRVDRHAGLADIADHARVIAVIAAVRGEIEGDRQALLPGSEIAAVEGVRFLGGRETRILPDRPGPPGIHAWRARRA